MSLKVGQSQVGSVAASRSAAIHAASTTDHNQQVGGLSGANAAGTQEETMRFTDTWEDMNQKGGRHRRHRLGLHGDAVKFGSVLASEDVGSIMLDYRSRHDIVIPPSLRVGAMLYERANNAIGNQGFVTPLGRSVNRLL